MNISVDQLKLYLLEIREEHAQLEIRISNNMSYQINLGDLTAALESKSFDETAADYDDTIVLESSPTQKDIPSYTLENPHGWGRALISPSKMIDLSDKDELTRHLNACFKQLKQLDCKAISKAWIRKIIPKKQSSYPYKGGLSTKPPFWPQDVTHREPDHLLKNERISLMVSIILTDKLCDAQTLFQATNGILLSKSKLAVLNEIYFIKDKLDHQEMGDCEVTNFSFPKHPGRKPANISTPKPKKNLKLRELSINFKNVTVPKFENEINSDLKSKIAALMEKHASEPSSSNSAPDRRPLSGKDPNLPPKLEVSSSKLETLAWKKLNKLYHDSKTLSPGHILSSPVHDRLDSWIKKPTGLLPPMKMMHLSSDVKLGVHRSWHPNSATGNGPVLVSTTDDDDDDDDDYLEIDPLIKNEV